LVALVILFYLPLQVYQLYRVSQMREAIIASIASGDPDIQRILELGTSDPTSDWVAEEVQEMSDQSEVNYEGVEILSHSRIYDLRRWNPDAGSPDRRGHVYVRDRIRLKLLETYKGDGRFIISMPVPLDDIEFRHSNAELRGVIRRMKRSSQQLRQTATIYEFEYDLSHALPEEPLTVELEILTKDLPNTVRLPFETHAKTGLISVWILFPAKLPYRTYSLVSYPTDRSRAPRPMTKRYSIDHPFGFLIGWSVVNPGEDRIYECRWTTE
jgi:hypothetical protein